MIRFGGFGIWLYFCDHNVIQGNYIGLDATGAIGPFSHGMVLSGSSNNLIGGTTSAARNVISGNYFDGLEIGGNNNIVQGNFIGTDVTGTSALGNGISGITISGTNNLIGGTTPGAGNLISGNQRGIDIHGPSNTVQGNLIGTDLTGTKAVANGTGISANDTLIGGLTSAARNILAEDVRALANTPFTQVTFRLPNDLAPGVYLIRIRAHGLNSNTGTIRITQ